MKFNATLCLLLGNQTRLLSTLYSILLHIFPHPDLPCGRLMKPIAKHIHLSFCDEAHVNLHIVGQEHTFTILNDSGVQKVL